MEATLHEHLCRSGTLPRTVVSKDALLIASHVIEDQLASADGMALLVSGFQRPHHWRMEHDRYGSIASRAEVVVVHAGPTPPHGVPGVRELGLGEQHPLSLEWFVIALGPRVSLTLCGRDELALATSERRRRFDTIFTVDPDTARSAASFVLDGLGQDRGPSRDVLAALGQVALGGPAAHTDALLGGMLERIDELRDRESAAHLASARLHEQAQTTAERERHRLAEALHDESLQLLLAAQQDLQEIDEQAAGPALQAAQASLRRGVRNLRQIVNAMDLSFTSDDLHTRLSAVCASIASRGSFTMEISVAPAAAGHNDEQIISLVRELVINAAKHARADRVTVEVRHKDGELVIRVADDGIGADPGALEEARADGHIGLALARERVQAAGGAWILRTQPSRGFEVTIRLPR